MLHNIQEIAKTAPLRGIEEEMMEENDMSSLSIQQVDECKATGYMANDITGHSNCTGIKLSDELNKQRSQLNSLMMEIRTKIELVDDLLAKGMEKEATLKTSNTNFKTEVKTVLDQMVDIVKGYSTTVMELLEAHLRPREEDLKTSVQTLSSLHSQLKETELQVNTLLEEEVELSVLEVEKFAKSLIVEPEQIERGDETNIKHIYAEMKHHNYNLHLKLGAAQRHLQNIINPSEVTFDSETLHPCLVLSEDLKTVSFSAVKQPYPTGPQRFTNYFQAMSSQSFSKGEHCWILQAEFCPWVLGICYEGLPRCGTESGLESRRGSWCLMWYENLLRAYEEGKETPLKRTSFCQKLEIYLTFNKNCVIFSSISNVTGAKTHLHTFNVNFTEPVFLAVRMMSGDPKARITVCV